jgi:predicted Zn-dependent protease
LSTGQTLMKLSRPFRPEDEAAADHDAVVWSFKAGYDPQALADLFLRLDRRQQNPKFPVPAMFRSHPVNEARRQAVLSVYDGLARDGGEQPLYVGVENLRRRVPRSKQEFPE